MDKTMRITLVTILIMMTTSQTVVGESILDWLWTKSDDATVDNLDGIPLVKIPYESLTEDEKFLQQAAKFSEIQTTSPLEVCQHKVIMTIKTSCSAMPEEELAKLAVNLLNCQSAIEGRKAYPCTKEMNIKDCTKDMNADTWNTYHLMTNRARAVCYAARSVQFRALAEMTVDKLLQSTQTQILSLNSMKEIQEVLQVKTKDAISSLQMLLAQEQNLKDSQVSTQSLISANIRQLNNEKNVIREGHAQLSTLTDDIKDRLDEVNQKIQGHSEIHERQHQNIIKNLTNMQEQAYKLLHKLENSADQYEQTLKKLDQINVSIKYAWDLTNTVRTEIDNKLGWISYYIDNKEEHLHKVYQTSAHVVYLIISMILAAFLELPMLTRFCIITITPLNLVTFWKHGSDSCLDFISITALISLITAIYYFVELINYVFRVRSNNNSQKLDDSDYSKSHPKEKSSFFKRFNLLQRLRNELYYTINSAFTLMMLIKDKICNYFYSTMTKIKSITPREIMVRSCSYVPSKNVHENIVDDDFDASADLSNDISNYNGKYVYEKSMPEKYVRHRLKRPDVYMSDNDYNRYLPSRSVSPSRKLCSGRTKSGNLCKSITVKGYNYCARHIPSGDIDSFEF